MIYKSPLTKKRDKLPHSVYFLICPLTRFVRYVGTSYQPKKRYNSHVFNIPNIGLKGQWIERLKKVNLKPILQIHKVHPNKSLAVKSELNLINTVVGLYNHRKDA